MKVALFSVDGYGFPIAYHLQEEGHDVYVGQVQSWASVKVSLKEKEKERAKRLKLYDGMFERKWSADKLLAYLLGQSGSRLDWLVICDFNWLWPYADKLRSAGYRGLLPRKDDYDLEHDRKATRDLIEKLYPEIETGEYREFKTEKDATAFLEKDSDKLYVLKGFNAEADTIVPESDDVEINRAIIIDALQHDKEGNYEKDGFILEEKIPDVIEFTPEAIGFDGQLRCINIDVEHKRFGSRSGPQVGCATNIVLWQNDNEKIYRMFLKPLEKIMLRPNELTIWDLSVLYSPSRKKYYAGEFCPNRMGFDAAFTEIATFGTVTAWIDYILGGEQPYLPIGVAVRLFNPDKQDALFIGEPGDPHVWCYDILKDGDSYHVQGLGKDVCVLTQAGQTIDEAIDALYEHEHDVIFDPAYHLEKHDWYDEQWPINLLHRIDVLDDLNLLKGGESNAQEKTNAQRNRTQKDSGRENRATKAVSAGAGEAFGVAGNSSLRDYS